MDIHKHTLANRQQCYHGYDVVALVYVRVILAKSLAMLCALPGGEL